MRETTYLNLRRQWIAANHGGVMNNTDLERHDRFEMILANITDRTNGNIIFREQMEDALMGLGGFSIRQTPTIMKAILKKRQHPLMAFYDLFRANLLGAYPDKEIDQMWESIVLSPALVETGSFLTHMQHQNEGAAENKHCAVCYGIKNKLPVITAQQLKEIPALPGSYEEKFKDWKMPAILALVKQLKEDEGKYPNTIVIDSHVPKGGIQFTFDLLRAKGEPISDKAKEILKDKYIKPDESLVKSYEEVLKPDQIITILPPLKDKPDYSATRVHKIPGKKIPEGSCCVLGQIEADMLKERGKSIVFDYHSKPLGCTCRDGKDHDLCPKCHEVAMKGMNVSKQITDEDRWGSLDTKAMAESHEAGKLKQAEDMEAWVERYKDNMVAGQVIDDAPDKMYPPDRDRLMIMRPMMKTLKEVDEILDGPPLGVPAINGVHHFTSAEVTGEDDSKEPEVCKCNIWAGCTCGVMERERARKAQEEG